MAKYCAFINYRGNYRNLEATLDAITEAIPAKNLECFFIYDGSAQKRYEMPLFSKAMNGIVFSNVDNIIDTSNSKMLNKIHDYLHSTDAEILLFLNEGEVISEIYTKYLNSFFEFNSHGCGVVFTLVVNEGKKTLPQAFQKLPRGGCFDFDENFPNDLTGAAVLVKDAVSVGFDVVHGNNALFDMVMRVAKNKNSYGCLNKVTIELVSQVRVKLSDDRQFLISCIIPIYNVEKYLEEAINSVISQTIGFKENVQLILINDGSTDTSGDICKQYANKYPGNVAYIEQENKGVSAARNAGLDAATGEYTTFLDADDKYDSQYLKNAIKKLQNDNDAVCVIGIINNFDFENGVQERYSLARYSKNRYVNISDNVTHAFYIGHVGQVIFRSSAICNIRFNENFVNYQDVALNFIGEVVNFKKLIFIENHKYYERKKFKEYSNDETVQREFYKYDSVSLIYLPLYEKMISQKGFVPFFIQQTIIENICQLFSKGIKSTDKLVDPVKLRQSLEFIVFHTDISILRCKLIEPHVSKYLNILKYGTPKLKICDGEFVFTSGNLEANGKLDVIETLGKNPLVINIICEKQGVLLLRANTRYISYDDFRLMIISEFQTEIIEAPTPNEKNKLYFHTEEIFPPKYYEIKINLNSRIVEYSAGKDDISFYFVTSFGSLIQAPLYFLPHSNMGYNMPFTLGDEYIIKPTSHRNTICALPLTSETFNSICYDISAYRGIGVPHPNSVRKFEQLKAQILSSFTIMSKRRIWLFIDRGYDVGNNAEVLFRYCATKKDDGIEKYYVIPSEEFLPRFEGLPCVIIGSDEYKLLCVFAEKFISSYLFGGGLTYEYGVDKEQKELWEDTQNFKKLTRSFFRGDIIHVQHGVIMQDISYYLTKYDENIRILLSVCQKEYDYLKNELQRAIDPNVLRLTGLPRLDELEQVKANSKSEKIVLFAPSFDWAFFKETKYIPEYKYSDHFRYLQSILGSKELIDMLASFGYKLIFKPHYLVIPMICDFVIDSRIRVVTNEIDRFELYAMCDLMISDYSGISWDFAYLKKPVVYAHFTKPKYDEVYFSYENDGFGEICRNITELNDTLHSYLSTGCTMSEKYLSRVDSFYSIQDGKNCERIYNELLALGDTRKIL